jgi:hypothetical protein
MKNRVSPNLSGRRLIAHGQKSHWKLPFSQVDAIRQQLAMEPDDILKAIGYIGMSHWKTWEKEKWVYQPTAMAIESLLNRRQFEAAHLDNQTLNRQLAAKPLFSNRHGGFLKEDTELSGSAIVEQLKAEVKRQKELVAEQKVLVSQRDNEIVNLKAELALRLSSVPPVQTVRLEIVLVPQGEGSHEMVYPNSAHT